MASTTTFNLGQISITAGIAPIPYQPLVLISMDKAMASKPEETLPFANANQEVSLYVQAIIEKLSHENDAAYQRLLLDFGAGRNVKILPGHSIYMFSEKDPKNYMPNPQDQQAHTYSLQDPSILKIIYRDPKYFLISHIEKIQPSSVTPAAPAVTPEKSWLEHAQTTSFPISYPTLNPTANSWSKASTKWSQITYPIFKKADDFSITIDRTIGKYTGVLSLAIRATLVALGIIGYGLALAIGQISYVPARYFFPKQFDEDGINIGTVTVFVNNQCRYIPNVRISFEGRQKLSADEIKPLKEHYRYYLQALINEINMHPDADTRMRFIAVFQQGRIPILIENFGMRFEGEVNPFRVPNSYAFAHKYNDGFKRRDEWIEEVFKETTVTPPVPNMFDHVLSEPIPIFAKPIDPIAGSSRLSSSSTKVAQAAHDVFTAFDGWAVSFDNATAKYLGAFSLIGRGILDLTGLVVGLGVLGLGHLIYVPIGAATGRDLPP